MQICFIALIFVLFSCFALAQDGKPRITKFIPTPLESVKKDNQKLYCYDPTRAITFVHGAFSLSSCGGDSYRISASDFEKHRAVSSADKFEKNKLES